MRIGVVSDTHGHCAYTQVAVAALGKQNIEHVIHCGDIGSTDVIELFAPWPAHFVFGNVDHNKQELRAAIAVAGQTCHDRFGSLELAGKRIAFLHSDDASLFRSTINDGEWDLVCYGHTHVAEQHFEGGTLVLNPGAIYRARPHSVAIVELPSLKVDFVELD